MFSRRHLAVLLAGSVLCSAAPALADPITDAVADAGRPQADRDRDAARKPAEMLAFAGVKPGAKVGELLPGGGYFTRILSKAVGADGKVYAYLPTQLPERFAAQFEPVAKDAAYGNVVVLRQPSPTFTAPEPLDVVWTSQNYHDMHNNGGNPAPLNAAIFAALKPGGIYVIVDHSGKPGTGVSETNTLHRIDADAVKAEVTRAGFKFDGESTVLRRAEDPRTAKVFELHDKTDQFVYRFKKPG
jgi:predicted methyltransferase